MRKRVIIIGVVLIALIGVATVFLVRGQDSGPENDVHVKEKQTDEEVTSLIVAELAEYKVTFTATWSDVTHPNEFPPNPHFSPFVAVSHVPRVNIFEQGTVASEGIKDMAETGSTTTLVDELKTLIENREAYASVTGSRIDSPGATSKILVVELGHSNITVVSMIAPSPDWFIAGTVELFEKGDWVQEKTVDVTVWDAGSDSGETFTSGDVVTTPQGQISLITDGPLVVDGDIVSMGILTFERM